jgi:hypothetical protein
MSFLFDNSNAQPQRNPTPKTSKNDNRKNDNDISRLVGARREPKRRMQKMTFPP